MIVRFHTEFTVFLCSPIISTVVIKAGSRFVPYTCICWFLQITFENTRFARLSSTSTYIGNEVKYKVVTERRRKKKKFFSAEERVAG